MVVALLVICGGIAAVIGYTKNLGVQSNGIPKAPPGLQAVRCQTCNAVQNVPEADTTFECWQCKRASSVADARPQGSEDVADARPQGPEDTRQWLDRQKKLTPGGWQTDWQNSKKVLLLVGGVIFAGIAIGQIWNAVSKFGNDSTTASRATTTTAATTTPLQIGTSRATTTTATSSSPTPATSITPTSSTPSSGSAAYGQRVQEVVLDGLMTNDYQRPATFSDMCQTTVIWACAIAKIESDTLDGVNVTLRPQDVWIDKWDGSRDWYDFGEYVARAVYTFARAGGVTSLREVDVYTSTGDLAYLSNF